MQIESNVSLQNYNYLKLNVLARHHVIVRSIDDLKEALHFARSRQLPVCVLGCGSNVVFSGNYDGLVIVIVICGLSVSGDKILAGAGEHWHGLVRYSLDNGLFGLENLSLIPGTAGAAPIQNIGAYGVELSEFVLSVEVIDTRSFGTATLSAADCQFGYRRSVFKGVVDPQFVITGVTLALSQDFRPRLDYPGVRDNVQTKLRSDEGASITGHLVSDVVSAIRRKRLPNPDVRPNVGSFYKNPIVDHDTFEALQTRHADLPNWPDPEGIKLSAAWFIDQCGLKGERVGDARISTMHALVMVNEGHATPAQVLELARIVQQRVEDRFGVTLSIEPDIR